MNAMSGKWQVACLGMDGGPAALVVNSRLGGDSSQDGNLSSRSGGSEVGAHWQVGDLDRVRDVGRLLDVHENRLFAPGVGRLLDVRSQLNQKEPRLPDVRTPVRDFRQPADFLEHPHYSDLSGHTSVLGILTAVHVPLSAALRSTSAAQLLRRATPLAFGSAGLQENLQTRRILIPTNTSAAALA